MCKGIVYIQKIQYLCTGFKTKVMDTIYEFHCISTKWDNSSYFYNDEISALIAMEKVHQAYLEKYKEWTCLYDNRTDRGDGYSMKFSKDEKHTDWIDIKLSVEKVALNNEPTELIKHIENTNLDKEIW